MAEPVSANGIDIDTASGITQLEDERRVSSEIVSIAQRMKQAGSVQDVASKGI